jgi:hypothetical protein
MCAGPPATTLITVDIDFALTIAASVTWIGAAYLADTLPDRRTARALRRRAGLLAAVVCLGVAAVTAAVVSAGTVRGLGSTAVAAGIALALAVPRLNRVRRGAAAFAAAPGAPMPPALRAAAAHPLVGFPVQVTALVSLPAVAAATGVVSSTPAVLGFALTAAVLVFATIGVRHALRHSRLRETAVAVPARSGRSPRAVGVLEV